MQYLHDPSLAMWYFLWPEWDFSFCKQPEIHVGVTRIIQDTMGELCLSEVAARDETEHLEAFQLAANTSDNWNESTFPTMYSNMHFESAKIYKIDRP